MNSEWSDKNKIAQGKLKKASFQEGINEFLQLREMLMKEILAWRDLLSPQDYYAIPFINSEGYHSKTIAYSIWHIIRIEDIVVNSLIRKKEEVLFENGFDKKTGACIITTGNELAKEEIAVFSEELNIDALYEYALAVKESTDEWLKKLNYEDSRVKFGDEDKKRIRELGHVSNDEKAAWLIEYWCGKDVSGLIKMPLSRHWIMHIEAANRIKDKLIGK